MRAVRVSSPWRVLTILLFLVALAAWVAGAAPVAKAAPPSDIWDLTTLQTHLDSGPVPGYFLTVLGGPTVADQTPVVIPATITSIVPGETDDGALILFNATGPDIARIGGIASGMSGSPLHVGDAAAPLANDPLIGAVSYGDIFTTDGLGLATPIEYMIDIQTAAVTGAPPAVQAGSARLSAPVKVGAKTIRRVLITTSRSKAAEASADTAAFQPLDALMIGGLNANSKLFKRTAVKLQAAGYRVLAAPAPAAAGAYSPDWTTPLAAGASVATLYANGDVWIGAAGTVTYVDDAAGVALVYGHPLDYVGSTEAYLTNAWVSGVWQDTMEPYKLMAPSALQGTVTQDRASGVEGLIGLYPQDTLVTAKATFAGKSVSSTTTVPQALASGTTAAALGFNQLPTYAAQAPIYKAIRAAMLAGSATTTSTVVVNDGTQDYTVTIHNVWDAADDVTWSTTNDLDLMLGTLTSDPDGFAPATIKSVDFSVDLSAQRNEARIVAVEVPGGLKIGKNDVIVKLAEFGNKGPLVTQHVTLTLPRGTDLGSGIDVYGAGYWGDMYYGPMDTSEETVGKGVTTDDRVSVADRVQELNEMPGNDQILVDFQGGDAVTPLLEGALATPWVVNGEISMRPADMFLFALPKTVLRGTPAVLRGGIMSIDRSTSVKLYSSRPGSSHRHLLTTVHVTMDRYGSGHFVYRTKRLKAATRFTAVWGGDDTHLGATSAVVVKVRAR